MIEQNNIFLLLGSNIEPKVNYIEEAERKLSSVVGNIVKKSHIYISEPWGFVSDQSFLNRVLMLRSTLSAMETLTNIHAIEEELGRTRQRNGYSSRTIDIDILYYNNDIINNEKLIVPHPRIHERRFTLAPLTDIAPDYIHPIFSTSNIKLLEICKDLSEVSILKSNH